MSILRLVIRKYYHHRHRHHHCVKRSNRVHSFVERAICCNITLAFLLLVSFFFHFIVARVAHRKRFHPLTRLEGHTPVNPVRSELESTFLLWQFRVPRTKLRDAAQLFSPRKQHSRGSRSYWLSNNKLFPYIHTYAYSKSSFTSCFVASYIVDNPRSLLPTATTDARIILDHIRRSSESRIPRNR